MNAEPKTPSRLLRWVFGIATGKKTGSVFQGSLDFSAGVSNTASKSAPSSQNSAATSKALAKASKDFEAFLEASGPTTARQRIFDQYLGKAEKHGLHKIDDADQP